MKAETVVRHQALITRKLSTIDWQVFWLAPSSITFPFPKLEQWFWRFRGHTWSLQQRCLLRIFT